MLATNTSARELIRPGAVREMLASPGPCLTILLGPYHPAAQASPPSAVLKAKIQEAARELAERGFPKSANLLRPLEALAADAALESGSHGSRAIFRSPGVFEQFHLAFPVETSLTVGGSFAIRKLAAELARPPYFYILALTKKGVTLMCCSGLHAEGAVLPHGVPATLAEAMEFEPPDHDLVNRSAIGTSTGTMHAVPFGTGSGREMQHAHLADYYKLVDRGIQDLIREPEIPLVLAGVEEDVAFYRGVSTNEHLVNGSLTGSLNTSEPLEPAIERAYALIHEDTVERQAAALAVARERMAPARFSTDADVILHAAFDGRVGQLFLSDAAQRSDVFERGNYHSWGKEDLLNLAMVQTILHHGKSCELPAAKMPDGAVAAALLRF